MGQQKNRGIIGILTGGGDVPGLNPAITRQEFVEGINREYEELRSKNSAKQVKTVSLEEAQKNKLNLW